MIPIICVFLFSVIGTWMLIEPLPVLIFSYPLEVIGGLTFVIYFNIVTSGPMVWLIVTVFRHRGFIHLLSLSLAMEAEIMSETPLGGFPEEGEEDDYGDL